MFDFLKGGKVNSGCGSRAARGPLSSRRDGQRHGHARHLARAENPLRPRSTIRQADYEYGYESTDSAATPLRHDVEPGQNRWWISRSSWGDRFPRRQPGNLPFHLHPPLTAQPTGEGSIFRLEWLVEITLDRKWGRR